MNTSSQTNAPEREIYPDVLRIIAIIAVIFVHSCAPGFVDRFPYNSTEYLACCSYGAAARFCVPVFIMVSGMFLLKPTADYSLKKLYSKKILRLSVAYLIWSVVYIIALAGALFLTQRDALSQMDRSAMLDLFGKSQVTLWFMFIIIGLYVLTPILRWIAKNEDIMNYFMILGMIFVFFRNLIVYIPGIGLDICFVVDRFDVKLVAGFSTYFLLGYWLANHELSKKTRAAVYVLGIVSVFATIAGNLLLSAARKETGEWLFDYLLPTTMLTSAAVFVFCKQAFSGKNPSPSVRKLISQAGRFSFGIYFVHVLFLHGFPAIGIQHFFIHPILSIPIMVALIFIPSHCAVWIIDKVPFFNKFAM